MVFRVALLTFFLLVLLATAGAAQQGQNSCRQCHPDHYPALGSCVDCHRGDPRTDRLAIAHFGLIRGAYAHFALADSAVVERGRQRLKDSGCRRCHVADGQGNRLAANLDRNGLSRTPEELAEAIRKPVRFMPDFHFTEAQIGELVNAILAGAARAEPATEEIPLVVHFEQRRQSEDNPFAKHCGSCHRLLSTHLGGLGEGEIGPNLSGLLTEHYPPTFRDVEPWTLESLEKWLKNPRESRHNTRMAPIRLNQGELGQVTEVFLGPVGTFEVAAKQIVNR